MLLLLKFFELLSKPAVCGRILFVEDDDVVDLFEYERLTPADEGLWNCIVLKLFDISLICSWNWLLFEL